jgi:hypothetical protein
VARLRIPGAEIVSRIAQWYKVTTDWLLTGEGPRPEDIWLARETLEWDDLVIDLGLPEPAHGSMLDLPLATARAALLFKVSELGGSQHESGRSGSSGPQ